MRKSCCKGLRRSPEAWKTLLSPRRSSWQSSGPSYVQTLLRPRRRKGDQPVPHSEVFQAMRCGSFPSNATARRHAKGGCCCSWLCNCTAFCQGRAPTLPCAAPAKRASSQYGTWDSSWPCGSPSFKRSRPMAVFTLWRCSGGCCAGARRGRLVVFLAMRFGLVCARRAVSCCCGCRRCCQQAFLLP